MRQDLCLGIMLAGMALAASVRADYTEIAPDAAYADTAYETARAPGKAIDGSGLADGQHDNDKTHMWMGKNSGNSNGQKFPGWFMVDFGTAKMFSAIKIWNFNMSGYGGRGLKKIDVLVSSSDAINTNAPALNDTALWTTVKSEWTLTQAKGNNGYTGMDIVDLDAPVSARWVAFRIADSGEYGGLSEVKFYLKSGVTLSIPSVLSNADGAVSLKTALHGVEEGTCDVYLVYGTTNGGQDASAWDSTAALGAKAIGGPDIVADLESLAADTRYYVSGYAVDGAGTTNWCAGAATFLTTMVNFTVKPLFASPNYEGLRKQYTITFNRPAGTSGQNDIKGTIVYGGTAVAGADYTPPESDQLALADKNSVSAALVINDNDIVDGDRTLTVSVTLPGYGIKPVEITIEDDDTLPSGTCVWQGGDGANWSDPGNWSGQRVPNHKDTVQIGSGGQIAVSGLCYAAQIVIDTGAALTFAADAAEGDHRLCFGGLERVEQDGATEGFVDFRVPIATFAASDEKCPWTIGGVNGVRLYADQARANESVVLYKTGAQSAVQFRGAASMGMGVWIYEGSGATAVSGALRGKVMVGGGENPATLTVGEKQLTGVSLYAYTNATCTIAKQETGNLSEVHVWQGALVHMNNSVYCAKAYFTGGRITGSTWFSGGYGQTMTAYEYDVMATMANTFTLAKYYDASVNVADGASAVDMFFSGAFTGDSAESGKKLAKTGAGAIMTTANMTNLQHPVQINAGTWYVCNTGTGGLGKRSVTVNAGGTLAGTGFLGGISGVAVPNVTAKGSATAFAVIAPGSVATNTGDRVYGTLTVGGEAQTNDVTFAEYSKLRVGIGPAFANDRLTVNGTLKLGGANSVLEVALPEDAERVKQGTYTVASATEGIVGEFADFVTDNPRVKVRYVETDGKVTSIVVDVPGRGLLLFLR